MTSAEVTGDTSSQIQESPVDNEMYVGSRYQCNLLYIPISFRLHLGSPSTGLVYKKSSSYPVSQPLSVNSHPSDVCNAI